LCIETQKDNIEHPSNTPLGAWGQKIFDILKEREKK